MHLLYMSELMVRIDLLGVPQQSVGMAREGLLSKQSGVVWIVAYCTLEINSVGVADAKGDFQ